MVGLRHEQGIGLGIATLLLLTAGNVACASTKTRIDDCPIPTDLPVKPSSVSSANMAVVSNNIDGQCNGPTNITTYKGPADDTKVGQLPDGTLVFIDCETTGRSTTLQKLSSNYWHRIVAIGQVTTTPQWVSVLYTQTPATIPTCTPNQLPGN